jgi:hypothetical protein
VIAPPDVHRHKLIGCNSIDCLLQLLRLLLSLLVHLLPVEHVYRPLHWHQAQLSYWLWHQDVLLLLLLLPHRQMGGCDCKRAHWHI